MPVKRQDTTPRNNRGIRAKESMEALDQLARKTLNMSGAEFIHAWESGEFEDQPETPELIVLKLLIRHTR